MQIVALVIAILFVAWASISPVQAEQSCSAQCRDQLRACQKNYAGKTCTSEYNICAKGCQKK